MGLAQVTWEESMERMRQDRTQRATLDEKEREDEELRSLLSSAWTERVPTASLSSVHLIPERG